MPKMKTRKSAAKRFSKTGSGKIKYNKSGARHFMSRKTTSKKRNIIWRNKALERIKEEPFNVLKTYLVRSPLLWLGTRFDIFILNKEFFPRDTVPWYFIKMCFYGLNLSLMLFGIIGIVIVWKKKNPLIFLLLPIIYTALIYMPFPSFENRYSQPVYPFVLVYAGIAFSIIFRKNHLKSKN